MTQTLEALIYKH